ncbi:hypothetical protein JHD50_04885 [Sulfurimonas sp. MAG313]|nr:hypothetical protein [Sulfurimonas sp. MAG313]
MRKVFLSLIEKDNNLGNFPYAVQGRDYTLKDVEFHKPNFGTYTYIIRSSPIKSALHTYLNDRTLKDFIFAEVPSFIRTMQSVRNESIHGDTTAFNECNRIRDEVIGIGRSGMLSEFTIFDK